MFALSIHDITTDGLAFDLIDILRLAESKVLGSQWTCSGIEAFGQCADELAEISRISEKLSGDALFRLAEGVYQVVDGDFRVVLPGELSPWLIIRAVDSSYYVVITADMDLGGLIKCRFADVRDSPLDLEYID